MMQIYGSDPYTVRPALVWILHIHSPHNSWCHFLSHCRYTVHSQDNCDKRTIVQNALHYIEQ